MNVIQLLVSNDTYEIECDFAAGRLSPICFQIFCSFSVAFSHNVCAYINNHKRQRKERERERDELTNEFMNAEYI